MGHKGVGVFTMNYDHYPQTISARKCGYYVGLWEDTMTTDLLWIVSDKFNETLSDSPRPVK